jgi:hypothetical protein
MSLHVTESPHVGRAPGRPSVAVLEDTITLFVASGGIPLPFSTLCRAYLFISRYSILPAMSLDRILHLAIQDFPYTGVQFNSFIDALLDNMNQFPQSNSVIVMDNASIHKSPELRQMVEQRLVCSCNSSAHD